MVKKMFLLVLRIHEILSWSNNTNNNKTLILAVVSELNFIVTVSSLLLVNVLSSCVNIQNGCS